MPQGQGLLSVLATAVSPRRLIPRRCSAISSFQKERNKGSTVHIQFLDEERMLRDVKNLPDDTQPEVSQLSVKARMVYI